MNLITLDFETYYDKGLGFKTQTTEEYIRDKRFEVIGVGVKINNSAANWFSGTHEEIQSYLKGLDWKNSALLCHNTMFDGAVLKWIFKLTPKYYLDTLCMARALHGVEAGGSLKALAERYELGVKGTEVEDAYGKRRTGFLNSELVQYGEYCKNDTELTFKLYQELSRAFPQDELDLIDMTLKMFIKPIFEVDDNMLQERLEALKFDKDSLLNSLVGLLKCNTTEEVRKKLASNKQFAMLLTELEVPVPMKTSKITGKPTYALAKNDEGFIALTEHEDPIIQELCAIRLNTKSTIEESRIERFINIGERNKGTLPIPLK